MELHSDGRAGRFASFVARNMRQTSTQPARELLQSAKRPARHSVSGSNEDVLHDLYF